MSELEPGPLDANQARALLDRLNRSVAEVVDLIGKLYNGRAWEALGHSSWDALCKAEVSIPRLGRGERAEVVLELRSAGLSTRAIGAAIGVDQKTVVNDLATEENSSVGLPDTVTSLDGRVRPATQPARRAPEPEPERQIEILDVIEVIEDEAGLTLVVGDECVSLADPDLSPTPDYRPTKPDLGGGISHPARYSDELFPQFIDLLAGYLTVLDPFGGTGKIHQLEAHDHITKAVEIEPEWATLHPNTIEGDALALPFADAEFDAICTSPTYGNRLADHHDAKDDSVRRSYTHDLGRTLNPNNSGGMHWGDAYREFHDAAWAEAVRVLRPGGRFVLNIKDHIRAGRYQDVTAYHLDALVKLGLTIAAVRPVATRSLRSGTNGELRVDAELVIALDKP